MKNNRGQKKRPPTIIPPKVPAMEPTRHSLRYSVKVPGTSREKTEAQKMHNPIILTIPHAILHTCINKYKQNKIEKKE